MVSQSDIQGHWHRRWLRAPGFEDSTTRVHWLQAGTLYADVRIPKARPPLNGAATLADLPDAALQTLAQAEGFAGTIALTKDICTWTRDINWHGHTSAIDAGQLSFDASGDLIEAGVHADYTELWTRPDATPGTGIRLTGDSTKVAYLVTVGDRFAFAIGDPSAKTFDGTPAGRRTLFDRCHLLGHWQGTSGIATLATNPFIEGREVLTRQGTGVLYHHTGFEGAQTSISLTP